MIEQYNVYLPSNPQLVSFSQNLKDYNSWKHKDIFDQNRYLLKEKINFRKSYVSPKNLKDILNSHETNYNLHRFHKLRNWLISNEKGATSVQSISLIESPQKQICKSFEKTIQPYFSRSTVLTRTQPPLKYKTLTDKDIKEEVSSQSHSFLMVKKLAENKRSFILKRKEKLQKDFRNIRQIPIHNTRFYLQDKKKNKGNIIISSPKKTEQLQTLSSKIDIYLIKESFAPYKENPEDLNVQKVTKKEKEQKDSFKQVSYRKHKSMWITNQKNRIKTKSTKSPSNCFKKESQKSISPWQKSNDHELFN